MSEAERPVSPADAAIDDAVEAALGALLRDRDVTEVQCLEGGFVQVVRRGRRERLDAVLEGPLFALLRDAGAEHALVTRRVRGGHRLTAAPCLDGRQALRLCKAPALDADLGALVDEQLVPPGLADELVAGALQGGVVVLGPSRAGRQRVACAIARAAQGALAFSSLTDGTAHLFPCPAGADVAMRAQAADALGFDALFALELDGGECRRLLTGPLALPLVASIRATSMEALAVSLGGAPSGALAALACVVGVGPEGRPRLLEVHGSVDAGRADAPPVHTSTPVRREPVSSEAPAQAREDELPPLSALPSTWASDEPDDDPGWELAGLPHEVPPPAPGSFDAALATQAARPSFAPRAPRPHPQAAKLAGNPFGGLTFEPPAAPPSAEAPPDRGGDDEEPR